MIAGGGAAGLTQGITSLLRLKSTTLTAGLGNHAVATGELGGALGFSLLALTAPVIAVAALALFCWFAIRFLRRLFRKAVTAAPDGRSCGPPCAGGMLLDGMAGAVRSNTAPHRGDPPCIHRVGERGHRGGEARLVRTKARSTSKSGGAGGRIAPSGTRKLRR